MSATYPLTMSMPRFGRTRHERVHSTPRPTQADRLRNLVANATNPTPSYNEVTRAFVAMAR